MRNDILKKFFVKENKKDTTKPTFNNYLFLNMKNEYLAYPQIKLENIISKDVCTKIRPKDYLQSGFKQKEDIIIPIKSQKTTNINKTHTHLSFNMIYCDVGHFIMGSNGDDSNPKTNKEIKKGFWLGEVEITSSFFLSLLPNEPVGDNCSINDPNKPIEAIMPHAMFRFCNILSRLQGLNACFFRDDEGQWFFDPNQNGYRLPFAFEWEYAAKAGTNNKYAGTNDKASLDQYAIFSTHNSQNQNSCDVATKLPNEWGFYDMIGNVWELCLEEDGFSKQKQKLSISLENRLLCAMGGAYFTKLMPSYIWSLETNTLTTSTRYRESFDDNDCLNTRNKGVGFRIARTHY